MNKHTFKIKHFLTRTHNEDDTIPFAWINTEYYLLNKQDIYDLDKYIHKKGFIKELIIVNNVEVARPQRTWFTMPDWFRPASMFHSFNEMDINNTFVFAIYDNEWGNDIMEEEVQTSIESFPKKSEIMRIFKTWKEK